MSDFLVWRDTWLMGIDDLDADHRDIVRLINRLADPEDPSPVIKRLNALTVCLHAHFAREEQFLDDISYPGFSTHAVDHAVQMAEFTQLRRDLEESGQTRLDAAALQGIKNWFFNHAIAEDRRFAHYYHEEYLAR